MGSVSCLLGLGWAIAGGGTIRFWGSCGVCVTDGWHIVLRLGGDSGDCFVEPMHLFWGGYYDGGCIPRPMQILENGIVSAVAVEYLSVVAK